MTYCNRCRSHFTLSTYCLSPPQDASQRSAGRTRPEPTGYETTEKSNPGLGSRLLFLNERAPSSFTAIRPLKI
ncbi:hypothetical protein M404DRAFT_1008269 [Pisolithus tinctorius Marx 270]|uniref:Uncharacterized protein n=1 Tax=Pisolithus tinctorius Marx 270 TaxID=870435 RepID=A0A0C3J9W8_PISTI|nr:hypothetical protein M404DRAFT_1008269 [Pisolithus tinctorius Marx 270]